MLDNVFTRAWAFWSFKNLNKKNLVYLKQKENMQNAMITVIQYYCLILKCITSQNGQTHF